MIQSPLIMILAAACVGAFALYRARETKLARSRQHRDETMQSPALHTDADWTDLDQLVLDIARLETLASWYAGEREFLRDLPIAN